MGKANGEGGSGYTGISQARDICIIVAEWGPTRASGRVGNARRMTWLVELIRGREVIMSCGTKEGDIHLFTPVKAIRRKCLDCVGSPKGVRLCGTSNCPLHPYRMGRHPGRSGIGGNPAMTHKNP